MENLLENADVTRISVNHARDFYKIYVKAKRLIFKKNIWKLEESIKKPDLQLRIRTIHYITLHVKHIHLIILSLLSY